MIAFTFIERILRRVHACDRPHKIARMLQRNCNECCGPAGGLELAAQSAKRKSADRKKRKDCAFLRQFDEKPSHIPGCPGTGRYRNSHSRGVCNWSTRVCVHLFLLAPRGDRFGVEQTRAGRLWRTGAETLFAVAVSCICKCFLQWTVHWLCYAVNTCLCTKDIQCQDDEKQLAVKIEVLYACCPANKIYHARHKGCHTRHTGYQARHRG